MTGSTMALLGSSLEVARATAWVAGVVAAVLVLLAAAWLTESRSAALAGALLALGIPYAAWLGVATVPDYPTAALLVVAMASAGTQSARRRLVGAACVALATLSRYEAWPIAATLACMWLFDARRCRSRPDGPTGSGCLGHWAAAALAIVGPLGWLAHGVVHHYDAWFFVKRVSDYQRALGQSASPVWGAVEGVLRRLLIEPEVVTLALLAVVVAWRMKLGLLARYRRPLLLVGVLVVFVIVGDARGSAPTHHAERALLSVWLLGAVFSAAVLHRSWQRLGVRGRGTVLVLAAGALGVGVTARQFFVDREPFIDRSGEVAIGRRVRALGIHGKVGIDTPDYGFFAAMAAAGGPERAEPLDDRDPRHPRTPDPLASSDELGRFLRFRGMHFLITTLDRAQVARQIGVERARVGQFALVELRP
jgi:hypothetical protein